MQFKKIFENAEQQHGGTVKIPRINVRQRNRKNHPADSAEEYYRRSMYFPHLDVCLNFKATTRKVHCDCLLPCSLLSACVIDADISNLRTAAEAYECFLPEGAECFEPELMWWKACWTRQPSDRRLGNVLDALKTARQLGTYPITETLL